MNALTARRKAFSIAVEAPGDPVDVSSAAQQDVSQFSQTAGQAQPNSGDNFGVANVGDPNNMNAGGVASNIPPGIEQPFDQSQEVLPNQPEDPESVLKKRLQETMIYFYHVIRNNIQTLSENPALSIDGSIPVISKVIDDLTKCSDVLYDTITKDFVSTSYIDITKKYVAVQKVYDVCIDTLKAYFSDIETDNKDEMLDKLFADRYNPSDDDLRSSS